MGCSWVLGVVVGAITQSDKAPHRDAIFEREMLGGTSFGQPGVRSWERYFSEAQGPSYNAHDQEKGQEQWRVGGCIEYIRRWDEARRRTEDGACAVVWSTPLDQTP